MKVIYYITIFTLIFIPFIGFAQLNYTPLVPLPGVSDKSTGVNLGNYLSNMYKLLIAVAIILAIVMISWAGIEYMGTDSVFGKTDAKGRIQNALGGVVLALTSWLILYTINPNLVKFNFLNNKPSGVLPVKDMSTTTPIVFSAKGGTVLPNGDISYVFNIKNETVNTLINFTGGKQPYTFNVVGLPQKVGYFSKNNNSSIDIFSKISEKPTPGTYSTKITATDSTGQSFSKNIRFILTEKDFPLLKTDHTIETGRTGQLFVGKPLVSGGIGPYSFNKVGRLPNGLSLNSNGVIVGTPTESGIFSIIFQIEDVKGIKINRDIILDIK